MAAATHTPGPAPSRTAPRVGRLDVVVRPAEARPPRVPPGLAAGLLVAGWVGLNVVYLAAGCPLDLAPDEAHYWHWSRHLDWCYYSKGPLVAWLIRGSCELFGGLSARLTGTAALAVRLPAVLSSAALLAGLYRLASDALRDPRAGLATVALALTLPLVTAGAVLMTIDSPFLACWCWALVGVMRAITSGGLRWWVFAGVCSALGVLAKYPMLLLPAAVLAFLLARRRGELRRPGVWVFVGLTLVGCVPPAAWNAVHGWPSVRHVLGPAGVSGRGWRWLGPTEFVATQAGLLLGFWFVAFVAAGWAYRRARDDRVSLLWWASVPVWLVFAAASLRNPGEANWPAAAYVGGLVLAVGRVRAHFHLRPVRVGWAAVVILGVGASAWARFPGLSRPVLAALAGPASDADPTPLRKLDPSARLRGWRTLAAEVDRLRERIVTETGREPVLCGMRWTLPGELAFYCRGRPGAYSLGPALGDRHSQYDLWRPNPVADAQAFQGRSFVYVGDEIPNARAVFDRVEPAVRVVHAEAGVPVAAWTVWVGHGFRGFPAPQPRSGY